MRASVSGSTSGSSEPLSPRVVINTCTSAPASAQPASVPPAEISGSSGWAKIASTRLGPAAPAPPPAIPSTSQAVRPADGPGDTAAADALGGPHPNRPRGDLAAAH